MEQIKNDKKKKKYKKELDLNGQIRDILMSNGQLYKQVGNSIVVNILTAIYEQLYETNSQLFDDIKLCSLFSGIGAFENALDRLNEKIENNKENN